MVRIVSTRWFHAVCSIKWVRISSEGAFLLFCFYTLMFLQVITKAYEIGMLKAIKTGAILPIVDIRNNIYAF